MRDWHRRVLVDTLKAAIPGKQLIRQALHGVRPYQTDPGKDEDLFRNATRQIELLREAGVDVRGKRILEIGTGWHPITAMVFLAAGANFVTMTDVERRLDYSLIESAAAFVRKRGGELPAFVHHALNYLYPYRTALSLDGSADIIVSCSVLEHIPAVTLEWMMADFRRILAPGGAMVHFIDPSDHYAQSDRSISRCNFLQYEDWQWRLMSLNGQNYHNRLRHSDYTAMLARNGFRIAYEARLLRETERKAVSAMKLASRFAGRDIDDLATVYSYFVTTA